MQMAHIIWYMVTVTIKVAISKEFKDQIDMSCQCNGKPRITKAPTTELPCSDHHLCDGP